MYAEKVTDLPWVASPIATADGMVHFASSYKTFVIKAGPKFELGAANVIDDGVFVGPVRHGGGGAHGYPFSAAAVAGGRIFILGANKQWCIGR